MKKSHPRLLRLFVANAVMATFIIVVMPPITFLSAGAGGWPLVLEALILGYVAYRYRLGVGLVVGTAIMAIVAYRGSVACFASYDPCEGVLWEWWWGVAGFTWTAVAILAIAALASFLPTRMLRA